MKTTLFEDLLKQAMGLAAGSVGAVTIERGVRSRMKQLGFDDPLEYRSRLQTSREELQELIETLVVSETWFHRDPEAFELLGRLGRDRKTGSSLRLLSIPCSTGEEPY